jgi:hypothetical protein
LAIEEDRRALEQLEIEHAALEEPRGVEDALGWMSGDLCIPSERHDHALPSADGDQRRRPQGYFLAEDPAKLPDWRFWEERQR